MFVLTLPVRGWNKGIGGDEENSSPELRGCCVREREDVVEPDLVCCDLSAVLPLRCRLWLCRRWMVGFAEDGVGENGNWVAILCELVGNECGVDMVQTRDLESGEECTS